MELSSDFFGALYLIATVLFILGLKGLSSPKTALRGNAFAMIGMAIAVAATLLNPEVKSYLWIFAGLIAGAIVGIILALRISMTAMPQLVAALHSFVGLSAVLVAAGTYFSHGAEGKLDTTSMSEMIAGSVIGAVTFSGSLVAFGKLQELLKSNPLIFRGQHALNLALGVLMVASGGYFVYSNSLIVFSVTTGIAFLLGLLLVLPIGGADMPVVVSMLNSYSGWAAAATGFTLNNNLLITTGALVGSSGAILSYIMCKAMNRSFVSVILGGVGGDTTQASVAVAGNKRFKSASAEDVAFMVSNSSNVIIIPGYGMAVSQAQHAVKEIFELLTQRGINVKFAIHPVAGRMPGHMNVLLAESDIPYEGVFEMDDINGEFSSCDVALVLGANDVVNPAAKTDKTSPLYGMPILDAYRAKQIFVSKRSMKPGYTGVDNDLFYYENCSLVFGDAKATCEALARAIKES